jgi:hypothetical protein
MNSEERAAALELMLETLQERNGFRVVQKDQVTALIEYGDDIAKVYCTLSATDKEVKVTISPNLLIATTEYLHACLCVQRGSW